MTRILNRHGCQRISLLCYVHFNIIQKFAVVENASHPGYRITLGFHTCKQPIDFELWSFWSRCRSQLSVSQLLGNNRFWRQTTTANTWLGFLFNIKNRDNSNIPTAILYYMSLSKYRGYVTWLRGMSHMSALVQNGFRYHCKDAPKGSRN